MWMDTVEDDMLRWYLSNEYVDDEIRWQSLLELVLCIIATQPGTQQTK